MKNPSILKKLLLQRYSGIFQTLLIIFRQIQRYLGPQHIQARYVSATPSYIPLDILRYIWPHPSMFWFIQGYSEPCDSQTCLCILRCIQNQQFIQPYSELLTYLVSFRHYSRAIHAYSEHYLNRLRHIQNSGLFRHVMFHAYSGTFTKLHVSRHICPHLDSGMFRILALPLQGMQGSNVKQHLLFKSSSFFKSLLRSIWNIF